MHLPKRHDGHFNAFADVVDLITVQHILFKGIQEKTTSKSGNVEGREPRSRVGHDAHFIGVSTRSGPQRIHLANVVNLKGCAFFIHVFMS